MITDIDVSIKELQKTGNSWRLIGEHSCKCDYASINNMLESEKYYDGSMNFHFRHYRKYGDCVDRVCVTSPCNNLRKIYTFNYSGAREV